ncbi:hypothetical protein ACEPAG_8294 [Sanghuangporus baumii]
MGGARQIVGGGSPLLVLNPKCRERSCAATKVQSPDEAGSAKVHRVTIMTIPTMKSTQPSCTRNIVGWLRWMLSRRLPPSSFAALLQSTVAFVLFDGDEERSIRENHTDRDRDYCSGVVDLSGETGLKGIDW